MPDVATTGILFSSSGLVCYIAEIQLHDEFSTIRIDSHQCPLEKYSLMQKIEASVFWGCRKWMRSFFAKDIQANSLSKALLLETMAFSVAGFNVLYVHFSLSPLTCWYRCMLSVWFMTLKWELFLFFLWSFLTKQDRLAGFGNDGVGHHSGSDSGEKTHKFTSGTDWVASTWVSALA